MPYLDPFFSSPTKRLLTGLVYFGMLMSLHAQDRASLEEFNKITSPEQRRKFIEQAPDDQKAALEKINMHQMLLAQRGGVAGLKRAIQRAVARAHGFTALTHLFEDCFNLHQYFYSGYAQAYGKVSALHDKVQEVGRREDKDLRTLASQAMAAHDLVYHLAITPQAAALERRAKQAQNRIDEIEEAHRAEDNPITAQECSSIDKIVDQILSELKTLPQMPPAQLQKEYDDFPEEELYQNASHGDPEQ